ncbi:NADH dehydrogenase subunit A [Rickettsia japonica]|uniref:NADH-quinone oxidoreductase subunit A n=3 Tax=Rickettsia japonica TaxID=35790 RepID=G4KMU2_RICJY|nr:NADH dehydrogenase alpha subunit [Rickettsia japonica YH]BAW82684.1 NADH dehydrogenase subunit A [Rickettsia japonica]
MTEQYNKKHMLQNSELLQEYLPIAIFFCIAVLVSGLIMILPNLLSTKKYNKDKLEPYECGFEPFSDARAKFDIRFYLVAILFIIFDLEIAFLVPWAISLNTIGKIGFFSMMFFLFVLIIGFIYEWKKGALDW